MEKSQASHEQLMNKLDCLRVKIQVKLTILEIIGDSPGKVIMITEMVGDHPWDVVQCATIALDGG